MNIEMNNIKNFRDIGGYFTSDERQIKWGQIYRSGNLSNATLYDQEKIRRLKIKTVIDFRSEQVILHYKYDLLNLRKYLQFKYHKSEINVEEVTMQDCILFIEHYKKVRNASKNTLS